MATHVDNVIARLTIDPSNAVYLDGKPTGWTIVRRGARKYRAIHKDGGPPDDRNSCSCQAEMARLAELIAGDECNGIKY